MFPTYAILGKIHFWTVVLKKTLESPLDWKEIQPIHPKRDQSWVFFGRSDVEAETPILWPPGAESWLIWKDLDAGKDWRQKEKGTMEDEMAGWHHWYNGHGFGWTLGVGDWQGGLVCCGSWGCKESDMTEWLNWTELTWTLVINRDIKLFFITACNKTFSFLRTCCNLGNSLLASSLKLNTKSKTFREI